MEIIIHQAICGEQNKAWDLLDTTLDNTALAKKIAFQTDLQDSPPSGLQWAPNLRGFLFGDYFLLIKTYPDNSPDVRNGRVFSHCLIIDKGSLSRLTDVRQLVGTFKLGIDKQMQLSPIVLTPQQQGMVVLQSQFELRFNKVVKNFLKFTSSNTPIVWVGQGDFETAVCKVWQLLTPSQRERFNFGINFNASEVDKERLSFVVIPENAESKFANKNFILIRKDDSSELTEFSEQFLAGHSDATSKIENFLTAIEAGTPTLDQIETISKAIPTFEAINSEVNIAKLNTLANIVAKFSPDSEKGVEFKALLIERIVSLINKANQSDVFLLRNFQIKAFRGSESELSQAIDDWCENHLLSPNENEKTDLCQFVLQVIELKQKNWLANIVVGKVETFFRKIEKPSAIIFWNWVKRDIKILNFFDKSVDRSVSAETVLVDVLPDIKGPTVSTIKAFAKERKWFRLYASILKRSLDFKSAMREQLSVDLDSTNFEGLNIIISQVKDVDILLFAVENGNSRLIQISGQLCRMNKKLLSGILVHNINWQRIWLNATYNGNSVLDGFKKPQQIVFEFFDLVVSQTPYLPELLEQIAKTEYTEISQYPKRDKLWSFIPSSLKNKFLHDTSAAVLKALSENSDYSMPRDRELSVYILSNGISDFLYFNRSKMRNVLPIFEAFQNIPQNMLADYVFNYSVKLSVVEATQLGQFVLKRNFTDVAEIIFSKSFDMKSFRPALSECVVLLNFIKKGLAILYGLVKQVHISADEWWRSFTELSYTLYDEGPNQSKIWTQADGKTFDLEVKGSGKEVWISALQKLRQEKCSGGITTKKLLKVMSDEHKKNESLKILKTLHKNI